MRVREGRGVIRLRRLEVSVRVNDEKRGDNKEGDKPFHDAFPPKIPKCTPCRFRHSTPYFPGIARTPVLPRNRG